MRKQTPESGVLRACLDLLAVHKIWHCRMNTGAVKDGTRLFRFGRKGMADILALPKSKIRCNDDYWITQEVLWIEAKANGGKQSPEQQAFEKEVSMESHNYLVVRDVNTLDAWLKEHGAI